MRYDKGISYIDGWCFAKVPYATALDFASYFIKHGIPAQYICRPKGDGYREIAFKEDTENFSIMKAWIESWFDGHERCPFCGCVAEIYESGNRAYVRCTGCGCMTKGTSAEHSEAHIWESWDDRI